MSDVIWSLERGPGPIVAAAIHDGHHVRDEVARHLVLDEAVRLREEDPCWSAVMLRDGYLFPTGRPGIGADLAL